MSWMLLITLYVRHLKLLEKNDKEIRADRIKGSFDHLPFQSFQNFFTNVTEIIFDNKLCFMATSILLLLCIR